jgi:hypothetical protein
VLAAVDIDEPNLFMMQNDLGGGLFGTPVH